MVDYAIKYDLDADEVRILSGVIAELRMLIRSHITAHPLRSLRPRDTPFYSSVVVAAPYYVSGERAARLVRVVIQEGKRVRHDCSYTCVEDAYFAEGKRITWKYDRTPKGAGHG